MPDLNVKSSALKVERSGAAPVATVDAANPWLGLVSFTEDTRSYFHGREEEAAELGRRVQRKLLTILFGQSGLGKTSILQAGLVPRLRPEGFCPVYVRLDYDPHSPPPAEQIKRAVFRATEAAGSWTQSGTAVAGETLWEFLHHRDDVLKDANGRVLTPILIFDQFEEIFTLAQSDDAGRKHAQEFLADLADLVENRPPVALEARIDRDEADASKFDFARADYRILISLREDYLAHLEGLKGQMPSVTQNRMRLARMTGPQAVAAVRAPAPHLVSEAVAEAVVRFVAGGADLARAEVEPSLLSLICRELNNTRLAKGEAEISAHLLDGSRDTILSEFYQRALRDQPPAVQTFIEDVLLTDSGFRESVAEERVRKGFAAAGAAEDALALLVDRRLLRVEDRLDLRRVEITHDVLCSVVGASRGVRREREALAESKRQLAAQRERELATRKALTRARRIAAVAVAVMLVAIGSAVFGFVNLRRAQKADAAAQASRQMAEHARAESEELIGFLIEDFYEELKPTGRVEIVGKLADKAVAYYDGLPAGLLTPQTRLNRGMALVRKATALAEGARVAESTSVADSARQIFEQLRAEAGPTDETTTALALAILSKIGSGSFFQQTANLKEAEALLRPLVDSGRASRRAKIALANLYAIIAHSQERETGLATCEEARRILAALGALDLTDLTAASVYGDATDTQARIAVRLGRLDDARQLATLVGEMAEKVLARRPGDLQAMINRYYAANVLGQVAATRNQYVEAEAHFKQAVEASKNYVLFNPADNLGWRSWSGGEVDLGNVMAQQGRLTEAMQQYRLATAHERDPRNKTGTDLGILDAWGAIMRFEAQQGNRRSARAALAEAQRVGALLTKERDLNPELVQLVAAARVAREVDVLAAEGDYETIHTLAAGALAQVAKIPETSEDNRQFRLNISRGNREWLIESALRLGRAEEAVAAAREAVARPLTELLNTASARRTEIRNRVQLGRALAAAGQSDEARTVFGEAIAFYRQELAAGAAGTNFSLFFARALYHSAQAQAGDEAGRARRLALLDEAMHVLGGLSLEYQQLNDSKELLKWVTDARREARARE
ncbi:MAG: hypothetical protein KA788_03580 [Lacunisphaera sp.]|nr:hypothetical protein [Lacunisphaera sp.]